MAKNYIYDSVFLYTKTISILAIFSCPKLKFFLKKIINTVDELFLCQKGKEKSDRTYDGLFGPCVEMPFHISLKTILNLN